MVKTKGHLFNEANRTAAIFYALISTAVLCFFIVLNANWILGDDVFFLGTTAIGKFIDFRDFIFPEIGRFLPFQLWDYNILRLLNLESAFSHYAFVSVSFFVFSFATFHFYKGIILEFKVVKLSYWLITFTTIFLSTRVYSIFLQLHIAERITVVLLSIFLYLYYKFYRSEKWIYGILSISVAFYLVYCKEPMFGALLTIPLTHFFFRYNNLTIKSKIIYYALAANSILFITLYYFLVYRTTATFYHVGDQLSIFVLFVKVFRSHKLLLLAFIVAFIRIYFVVIKKDRNHLFVDGLLFSGIIYTCEVLITGLHFSYYYFPAVLFTLPSLIYWSLKLFPLKWVTGIMLVSSLYCSYIITDDIKNTQEARKTIYPKFHAIADIIETGYDISWLNPTLNELDPYSRMIAQWKIDCFNVYLNYVIQKTTGKELPETPYIDKISSGKYLIMYPEEYHSISENINIHNSTNPDNTYSFFIDVGGIVVYRN